MKFRVTFKDPDGPFESIREEAKKSLPEGLAPEEVETLLEARVDRLTNFAGKFFSYGEYVTIELDTEAGTAVVVKTK